MFLICVTNQIQNIIIFPGMCLNNSMKKIYMNKVWVLSVNLDNCINNFLK